MDYRRYATLLERYNEADKITFERGISREDVISRLMQVSRVKKEIKSETNEIIRECITKYEENPKRMDREQEKRLLEFLDMLLPGTGGCLDTPIAFRIARLLMQYYESVGDSDNTILMLERCAVFDIMIKEHLDEYAGSEYARMAEPYLERFDELSERSKRAVTNAWLLCVINRKDMTFGLKKYKEIRVWYEKVCESEGADFMAAHYYMCQQNVLAFAMEACRRAEYAKKEEAKGVPMIDIEAERPWLEELAKEIEAVLESGAVAVNDRVVARLFCAQAAYHLGTITLEELFSRFQELSVVREELNPLEQCSALFTANAYYLDYLCKCSAYDTAYICRESERVVEQVLAKAHEMDMERFLGSYQTNYCVLMLVYSASASLDFDKFKNTVLSATVYANKALYVHTMMVRQICGVILDYLLEHNPQYLDGVAGLACEDSEVYRRKMWDLIEKCALFHDIGKYFCLDYVSNSSRSLTDEEFEVIKDHTGNFSKIYQGNLNRETACIRDCALLHHLWHNGQGGYPRGKKHTENRPFVDIISIADSLDAATDNIGRPYGQGKSFAELLDEFDSMKGERYSAEICELLRADVVRERIEHVLSRKRREIYCDIYLS